MNEKRTAGLFALICSCLFILAVPAQPRPENAASIRVAEKLGMRHEADGLTRSGDPMLIFRLRP